MPAKRNAAAREARWGQKMIEVKVRFWTDNLAPKGKVDPKNAWSAGVVRVARNDPHGIAPARPIPFNSLLDLGAAIEKALIANGIVLHANRKMRKYIATKA